jgi:hypothetical protein
VATADGARSEWSPASNRLTLPPRRPHCPWPPPLPNHCCGFGATSIPSAVAAAAAATSALDEQCGFCPPGRSTGSPPERGARRCTACPAGQYADAAAAAAAAGWATTATAGQAQVRTRRWGVPGLLGAWLGSAASGVTSTAQQPSQIAPAAAAAAAAVSY